MGDREGDMVAEATGTRSSNAIDVSHHFRLIIFIASLPFNYNTALVWLTDQEWPTFTGVENWHTSCPSLLDNRDQGSGINASTTFDGSLSQLCLTAVTA
jgi:hypothetical protein